MREYLLPYPYTITIVSIVLAVIVSLIIFRKKINFYRYTSGLIFTLFYGVSQIHGMINVPKIPAWEFPPGASLLQDLGFKFGDIVPEDVVFCIACYSSFYCLMFSIKNIKDFLNSRFTICFLISAFIVIEALIYQSAGIGAQILINIYTIPPIFTMCIYCLIRKPNINVTHVIFSLLFVLLINCGWDFMNAYLQHWVYNVDCELFSKRGFFLDNRLHTSIFFQYAISGWVIMYSCWIVFNKRIGKNARFNK